MLGSLQDADIKLLGMFSVIVKCGGFAAAQAQLNLSQSAISTRMAQLEARLNCRLCERGHGVFKLTSDGEAVVTASEMLFSALEDFRTNVAELQGQLTGELRLGLIDNTVTQDSSLIRDAISTFVHTADAARVSIYVGGAVDLEQQVLDDRLHVAIGLFHHKLESLDYIPLMHEEHMLYCASSHPLFGIDDAQLSERDLVSSRYVSWGYGEGLPGWQAPFSFNDVASSPHIEGVAYLILSGAYLGYLPTHYARNWVGHQVMRSILPQRTSRLMPISLVRRKSARVSKLTQFFIDQLNTQRELENSRGDNGA
jgi:DNA-binding transcriptional LysR family regulator